MPRKRKTSAGSSRGAGPRAGLRGRVLGYGVQGPGPRRLLFTVLLQIVPFLNAEGWMGTLLWFPPYSATGWSVPCGFKIFMQFNFVYFFLGWEMPEERLGKSQRASGLGDWGRG